MRAEIQALELRFRNLYRRTMSLLEKTENDHLFVRSAEGETVGELVLRSAGAVEQMVGGITRRLWDDPFEWTLRERMQSVKLIADYINEVESSRQQGFLFLKTDDDLGKLLPAPVEMKPLGEILNDACLSAEALLIKAETLWTSRAD